VSIRRRIERAEGVAGIHNPPAPRRRLLELVALGSLRQRGRALDVAKASESELLAVIGADAESFDSAIRGFGQWWCSGGREEMKARGYDVRHFNL